MRKSFKVLSALLVVLCFMVLGLSSVKAAPTTTNTIMGTGISANTLNMDRTTALLSSADQSLFSAYTVLGAASNGIAYNSGDGGHRMYGNSGANNGNALVIQVKSGQNIHITGIEITISKVNTSTQFSVWAKESTDTIDLTSGKAQITPANRGTVVQAAKAPTVGAHAVSFGTVKAKQFYFANVTSGTAQVVFSTIAITYEQDGGGETSLNLFELEKTKTSMMFAYNEVGSEYQLVEGSAALRFGATIEKELFDAIAEENSGKLIKYGVQIGERVEYLTPVQVAEAGAAEEDLAGEFYQFAILLTGITAEELKTEITAKVFVEVAGEKTFMIEATHSIVSLAQAYVDLYLEDLMPEIEDFIDVLDYIAGL